MRILQVCPLYYPAIGGVEQHVKNISERLAHENDITIFTCDPSGQLPKEETINGVKVRRFHSFSPQNAYHLSFEMMSALRRSSFDIVHGHNYHALPLFFSRYCESSKFIVSAYYHGHGHTVFRDFLLGLYKPFGRSIFKYANRVVALSNFEKSILVKDFCIDDRKIAVIPYGINMPEFSSLQRERGEYKKILYIGRLEQYKGVQYVVKAMQLLDTEIHLEIIGKGPYKGYLVNLTKYLGIQRRVSFLEDLPREELLKRYASANLFVMLSRYESFSIVVAEALAAKVPCIVAKTSALIEWIDNNNCFGIDYPLSIERLAQLINSVISKQVGDVELWDWNNVVSEIIGVYRE